jgi:hypothetical protein
MSDETTPLQHAVVTTLVATGFDWIREIDGATPGTVAVLLTKTKRFRHFHAEVEADGSVNGLSLPGFLAWLKGAK